MAEEISANAAYDSVKPEDILAARDWINANLEKLNALGKSYLPDEFPVEELPKGDVSYKNPAFAQTFQRAELLTALMKEDKIDDKILPEFDRMAEKIKPLIPVIQAHADLHDILQTGIELDLQPQEALNGAELVKHKYVISEIINSGEIPGIPAFDIRNNPLDPKEPSFTKSFNALDEAFTIAKLTKENLDAKMSPQMREKIAVHTITDEERQTLEKELGAPMETIQMALTFHTASKPGIVKITNAAKPADTAKPEAPSTNGAPDSTTQEQQKPPQQTPFDRLVQDAHPKAFRAMVMAVEGALEIAPMDGLYDNETQQKIEDFTAQIFAKYSRDYLQDGTRVHAGPPSNEPYEFDEEGNIYALEEKEGKLVRQPEKVGNIRQGIKTGDGKTRPHPATIALLSKISAGRDADLLAQKIEETANAQSEQQRILHERLAQIGRPDLEESIRMQLRKTGNNEKAFRDSEAGKNLLEADPTGSDILVFMLMRYESAKSFHISDPAKRDIESEQQRILRKRLAQIGQTGLEESIQTQLKKTGSDEKAFRESEAGKNLLEADPFGADNLISLLMLHESAKYGLYTSLIEDNIETGKIDAVFNLLHFMGTNEAYDPKKQADLKAGILVRDNILALPAYNVLRHMKGGDHINIAILYDEAIPGQKEKILAAFGNAKSASREDVYDFVQKEFEDRAIATLTGEKNIDRLSPEERAEALKGVSQAMAEGRFNPYEKDVELVFKGLGRPGIQDKAARGMIDRMRAGGDLPNADFMLRSMTDAELIAVTGREDFAGLSHQEKSGLLQPMLDAPGLDLQKNPAFERMMMNYHERSMGNYTWWRNGEVGTEDTNTWNGRYGGPNEDQLLHIYMRYHWHKLDREFGKEDADLMRTKTGRLNYDVKLADVLEKMSPESQQKLRAGIDSLSRPSMYSYLIDLRRDHYRELRNEKYVPTLQKLSLSENFESAADTQGGAQPDQTHEDKPANALQPAPEGSAKEETGEPETEAVTKNEITETVTEPETEEKKNPDIPITDTVEDHFSAPVKGGGIGIVAWKKANAAPNGPVLHLPDGLNMYNTKPVWSGPEAAPFLDDAIAKPGAVWGGGAWGGIDPDAYPDGAGNSAEKAPVTDTAKTSAAKTAGTANTAPEGAPKTVKHFGDIPIPTEQLSKLGSAFKSAGIWAKSLGRSLPFIGGGIAAVEVSHLTTNMSDLMAAGLIPEDAGSLLAYQYATHIGQSSLDPTFIGGESATWGTMAYIADKHNLDLVTAGMVSPDLLTKLVKSFFTDEKDIAQGEIDLLKMRYGNDQALQEKYYGPLIAKYNLPETISTNDHANIPLGLAIRVPGVADALRERYPDIKHLETVNQVAGHARSIIDKVEKAVDKATNMRNNADDMTNPVKKPEHPQQDKPVEYLHTGIGQPGMPL